MTLSTWRQQLLAACKGSDYIRALRTRPSVAGQRGSVSSLTVYPLKACGGIATNAVRVTPHGLALADHPAVQDRMAMFGYEKVGQLDDKSYSLVRLSQRECPDLARITVASHDDGLHILVPGFDVIIVPVAELMPRSGPAETVLITSKEVAYGVRVPHVLADALRVFLRTTRCRISAESVHLVVPCSVQPRLVSPMHACDTGARTWCGDGGSVLLASTATLATLNAGLIAQQIPAVPMAAFRPNLVVAGWSSDTEDLLQTAYVGLGGHELRFGGLCVRCPVTMVVPSKGQLRTDGQPLAQLAKTRPGCPERGGTTFGCNVSFVGEGFAVTVGDVILASAEKF
jgi:hypothetical protein